MMPPRRSCIALGATMLLAAGCAGSTGSVEREVQPMVLGLMDRLNPEGGRVSGFSGLRRDTAGVQASWDIEPGKDWPAYSAWLRGRIPTDFRVDAGDPSRFVLRKSTAGDFYVVTLEPVASVPAHRVRATFAGRPN